MNSGAYAPRAKHATLAASLAIAVLAFRDVRLLGLGMVGWQVIVGMVLMLLAHGAAVPASLRTVFRIWLAFGAYAIAWTVVALVQTGQVWPGTTLDLCFACGLLAYGASLDGAVRRRWLLTVVLGYFLLNFGAGAWELLFSHDALEWVHKTDYNAEGRLRMLAAEPSHIYAPFLVGGGLLWALLRSQRLIVMGLILVVLLLSSSKAFPPVIVIALTLAWLKAPHPRPDVQRRVRFGLLAVVSLGLLYLAGPGVALLGSDSPIAQLLDAGVGIVDYLERLPSDEQGSFATRATLFIHSASIVIDNPLVGVGPAGEAPAILERALGSGLITPEIIVYAQESPEFITSKTLGLTLIAYYGLPFLLTASYSVRAAIHGTPRVALIFAPAVIVLAAFSTEGYNAWAWLALCLLTSDTFRSSRGPSRFRSVRRTLRLRRPQQLRQRSDTCAESRGVLDHPWTPMF